MATPITLVKYKRKRKEKKIYMEVAFHSFLTFVTKRGRIVTVTFRPMNFSTLWFDYKNLTAYPHQLSQNDVVVPM
jgi:hypothetical protein